MARIGNRIAVATAALLVSPTGATASQSAPPPAAASLPPPPPVTPGPFLIFFDWDKADISPQAARILDNAVSTFQGTGQARVLVNGYADRSGPSDYNVTLSQRRADNVRDYLVRRGVPKSVVATEAIGESRLLVETVDGVSHPHNRRVEVYFPERP